MDSFISANKEDDDEQYNYRGETYPPPKLLRPEIS